MIRNLQSMIVTAVALLVGVTASISSPAQVPATLPVGRVIESVPCSSDPSQSYSLYLPASYTAAQKWPIIYAFDPEARGSLPLERYKDVAEKYGYILAGSNNARNFSLTDSSRSANAIWLDTHARLSLDSRRVYATGFSGGARVAGLLASRCPQCNIAGVIAHGAGYANGEKPAEANRVPYFLTLGDEDFNWPEVIGIRRARETAGADYRVLTFHGPHEWAPVELFEDAVQWLKLKAMQAGSLAPEPGFIANYWRRIEAQVADAEKQGDAIAELNAYHALSKDFAGLKDTAEYDDKLRTLMTSTRLRAALKKEGEQIARQYSLVGDIAPKLESLKGLREDESTAVKAEILQAMKQLKNQSTQDRNEKDRKLYTRSFEAVWAQGIESGQAAFESRNYAVAQTYFALMEEAGDSPWPSLLLAETWVAMGHNKQAVRALQEAVKRGLKDPKVFEQDPKLESLRKDAEFQKLELALRAGQ